MDCEMNLWGRRAAVQPDEGQMTKAGWAVWARVHALSQAKGECWAKAETIARYVRLKLRTVQKWLGRFRAWGWIEAIRRGRKSSVRRVTHRAPCALAVRVERPPSTYLTQERLRQKTMSDGVQQQSHRKQEP